MKDFFKRVRMEIYLSAILTIVTGIVLMIWPLEVTGLICKLLGALLAIMGGVYLFGYFVEGRGILSVTGGLVFLLLGIWIFLRPSSIMMFVPIFIGVVLLVHGLKDFQMAAEEKRVGSSRWWISFLMAFMNWVLGAVCICHAFGVVKVAIQLLAVALIYDGVTDMIIAYRTVRVVQEAAKKLEPIDVDAHEV